MIINLLINIMKSEPHFNSLLLNAAFDEITLNYNSNSNTNLSFNYQ